MNLGSFAAQMTTGPRPFEKSFEFIGKNIEEAFRSRQTQARVYRPTAGDHSVTQEMLNQINSAHFGIADITFLNQNVLIEVGVMIGIGKPLVIMKKIDDKMSIPFNIAGRQCFLYEQSGEEIFIHDVTSKIPLQEFTVNFVDRLLLNNKEFREAKKWFGS
jgi:hypothetical protein